MPYTAEISRGNPGCFIFLVDQSASMNDEFGIDSGKRKSDGTADAINRLLQNIIIRSTKEDGVRRYFDVAIIGYGTKVDSITAGKSMQELPLGIDYIADNPLRVEERRKKVDDGAGGIVEENVKFPVWVDPKGEGHTPMCQALDVTYEMLKKWTDEHQSSFPPIAINITDGEATDGDPELHAQKIKELKTSDGNVLLYNCHISTINAQPIVFVDSDSGLPDEYAKLLFRMSSTLPPLFRESASAEGFNLGQNSRGFAFNADLVSLIRFLDIGTRPSTDSLR